MGDSSSIALDKLGVPNGVKINIILDVKTLEHQAFSRINISDGEIAINGRGQRGVGFVHHHTGTANRDILLNVTGVENARGQGYGAAFIGLIVCVDQGIGAIKRKQGSTIVKNSYWCLCIGGYK